MMSDDLISRQAAVAYAISGRTREIEDEKWIRVSEVRESLKTMPSSERNKGKWIKMSDANGVYWACSECGEEIPRVDDFDPQFDVFHHLKSLKKTNFCPHCGAKMEETLWNSLQ